MSKRLTTNVIFSFLNALVTLLFPLITHPYVSRVLMPEGIGAYNIAFSVMSYFLLFANMGIPIYAVRAVSKARDDGNEMRRVCSSVIVLHAVSTIVVFALYIGYVCFAPNMQNRFWVNFITGFHILGIFLNVEWFYQGREEYGAITVKNLIVKAVSLALILIFVKTENDLVVYALIMIFSVVAYGLFNFVHFIIKVKPKLTGAVFRPLFKPVLLTFALYAASRLATGLDVIMIDFMLGDNAEYVAGQYAIATKFVNVIIDLLLVINTVMLPRLALLIEQNKEDEVKKLSVTAEEILFLFVLPATIGLIFVSENITLLFFGEMYRPAIETMMVMSANVLFAVFNNFIGIQILYAHGKDVFTTIAILVGAAVNITCNLFMIPRWLHLGAAIATIVSNAVTFIIEAIGAAKWKYLSYFTKNNLKTVIASAAMSVGLVLMAFFLAVRSNLFSLLIKVAVSVAVYLLFILVMKHESVSVFGKEIKSRFGHKKPPSRA